MMPTKIIMFLIFVIFYTVANFLRKNMYINNYYYNYYLYKLSVVTVAELILKSTNLFVQQALCDFI